MLYRCLASVGNWFYFFFQLRAASPFFIVVSVNIIVVDQFSMHTDFSDYIQVCKLKRYEKTDVSQWEYIVAALRIFSVFRYAEILHACYRCLASPSPLPQLLSAKLEDV